MRAAIRELIVNTVASWKRDGKRKEFGQFCCILSKVADRWEARGVVRVRARGVRGHVAESESGAFQLDMVTCPQKVFPMFDMSSQVVQKMKYLPW